MSKSGLQMVVDSWVIDVQRRGAELYAMNRANEVLYLSFQGEDQLHYSIEIDFDIKEVIVQMNRPDWDSFKRQTFLLNAENLRLLAKKLCPLPEREAIVPVYLLERLSILCHAYERLLQEYERKPHFQTSTNTVLQIRSELRKYLTPEEQRRTDDPLLQTSRRSASFQSFDETRLRRWFRLCKALSIFNPAVGGLEPTSELEAAPRGRQRDEYSRNAIRKRRCCQDLTDVPALQCRYCGITFQLGLVRS